MRRVRSSLTGPAEIADPDVSSVPYRRLGPRCGRVLKPYEGVWGALLGDVRCGRPEGHRGVCRSVQLLERERQMHQLRQPQVNARRKAERARVSRERLMADLAAAVEQASAQARFRALGRLCQIQAHSLQIQCPSTRMMSWPTST